MPISCSKSSLLHILRIHFHLMITQPKVQLHLSAPACTILIRADTCLYLLTALRNVSGKRTGGQLLLCLQTQPLLKSVGSIPIISNKPRCKMAKVSELCRIIIHWLRSLLEVDKLPLHIYLHCHREELPQKALRKLAPRNTCEMATLLCKPPCVSHIY